MCQEIRSGDLEKEKALRLDVLMAEFIREMKGLETSPKSLEVFI
jgi:hypothetical protein